MNNLNNKLQLDSLYDQLESQLRSLETLGVTSDTFSAMLYPLVESCLPEELLRTWQRHTNFDTDADLKTRLDALREFLRKEVDNEERISLAVSGFSNKDKTNVTTSKQLSFNTYPKTKPTKDLPFTASDLINYNKSGRPVLNCVFCNSSEHLTVQCEKAQNISQSEITDLLHKNGCCFKCTKFGHISKKCRVRVVCSICKGRHVSIMCRNEKLNPKDVRSSKSASSENSLANNVQKEVFLQTLVVKIRGQSKERSVRAIIDTGSQRSYILKETAIEMKYIPIGKVNLVHNLFGGSNTDIVEHTCYRARLGNLDNTYSCNFEVLDQNVICNNVSPIKQGPWIDDLHQLGVRLTDRNVGPIEVLIGADIAGKLLTDQRKVLDCGLVAVGTHLGWTLIGKTSSTETEQSRDLISVTTSMFINDKNIANLWELDTIGIKDPIQKLSKVEEELELINNFNSTVTVSDDGRYKVHMPWIEDHPPLPTNINIAKRRLESTVNKLKQKNFYDEYDSILRDWEKEGIIEEVPVIYDTLEDGHYLPHRPVYKENSTTRVRPVFDASAKEYNQPSLNDCLNKGINLIELIPSIILRFRLKEIGVISDIKKAFLQISLSESDRDFVRFLWLDEDGKLKVYRHTRVVFGVSCSPFLLGAVIKHHLNMAREKCINSSQDIFIEQLQHSFYVDNCLASVSSEEDLNTFIKEASDLFAEAKFELRGWEYSDKNLSTEIPPTPVLGGWWERLIGLTKQLLRRTLGNVVLSYEELYTVMCDCEIMLNSRPLTYISEDANDLIPITPSMFLGEAKEFGTPDLDYIESRQDIMGRRLRFLQKLRNDLRLRFRNEYLGQLVLRPKHIVTRSIKKGEIVLVENENKKRLSWPLAIVEDVIEGKDGNIRVVKLRTKSNTLLRPIQKVYPLEVQDDDCLLKPRPSMKKENTISKIESEPEKETVRTKSGRKINRPSRYVI